MTEHSYSPQAIDELMYAGNRPRRTAGSRPSTMAIWFTRSEAKSHRSRSRRLSGTSDCEQPTTNSGPRPLRDGHGYKQRRSDLPARVPD
jgi:hypothetical protein